MKHKLSQWHSVDTKPVHVGVYQVKTDNKNCVRPYAYWDGKLWSVFFYYTNNVRLFKDTKSATQNKQWRGIAK